jgi:LysM repeat protein
LNPNKDLIRAVVAFGGMFPRGEKSNSRLSLFKPIFEFGMTCSKKGLRGFAFFLCFFLNVLFSHTLEHVVQKGETLYSISREFSVSVDDICKDNGIKETDTLKAGQKLIISSPSIFDAPVLPGRKPETHKVAQDETLFSIARKYGMSVADIKELNNLTTDTIKTGQILTVYNNIPQIEDPRNYTDKQGDPSLVWPVKPSSVTYVTGKISGVQLAAKKDEDVVSISGGTVMFSELYRGFGQVVFVQNPTGHVYVYAGLASVFVQKGDSVRRGSLLGKTGIDPLNGKSQITLMVSKNGKYVDPAVAPRE